MQFAYGIAEEATKLILEGSAARWKHAEMKTKKNSIDVSGVESREEYHQMNEAVSFVSDIPVRDRDGPGSGGLHPQGHLGKVPGPQVVRYSSHA